MHEFHVIFNWMTKNHKSDFGLRINPYYTEFSKLEINIAIQIYFLENDSKECTNTTLQEVVKAFIRGQLIQCTAFLKKKTCDQEVQRNVDNIKALEQLHKLTSSRKTYH